MSSNPDNPPEAGAPEPEAHAEEQPEPETASQEKAPRHRLRWVFLCIAASAVSATSFLLFQLELGAPLSFANTILLTLLVAAVLPLLLIALLGKALSARGFGYMGQFILVCLLLSVTFAALNLS